MFSVLTYSLIAMLAFGIASAVAKTLVERHGAIVGTVRREFFSILVLGALLVWVGMPETISVSMVALGALIAALSYGGPFFQLYALSKNDVGVVVPITSFRIVVMSVVGVIFLGEHVSIEKIVALVLVFLGILIATTNIRAFRDSELWKWESGVPAALLAACVWGVTMPFFVVPTLVLGALLYALIIEIVILVLAVAHARMRGEQIGAFSESIVPEAIVGVGLALGTVFLNLALATGEITIASAISGSSVLVSVLVGAVWYGERLHVRQYIGALVVVLGILFPFFAM